jgi:hypothetical protein
MKRMVRLEQSDIELAITKALAECAEIMIPGTSKWILIKADKAGERDGLAYVCDVTKADLVDDSESHVDG